MNRLLPLWMGVILFSETKADSTRNLCGVCSCDSDVTRVDCSGRRLRELPDGLTAQIKHLNLSNNDFEMMPNLQHFKMLQSLDLSLNKLSVLPADSFQNLTRLKYLNLSHNSFDSWISINPSSVLIPAKNLKILDISYNLLNADLNEERLKSDSVEVLIFENGGFTTTQVQLNGLTNLRVLKMDSSEVESDENVIYVCLCVTAVFLILSYCLYVVWRVNCIAQEMNARNDEKYQILVDDGYNKLITIANFK